MKFIMKYVDDYHDSISFSFTIMIVRLDNSCYDNLTLGYGEYSVWKTKDK